MLKFSLGICSEYKYTNTGMQMFYKFINFMFTFHLLYAFCKKSTSRETKLKYCIQDNGLAMLII